MNRPPTRGPQVTWSIVSQAETYGQDAAGNYVEGMKVSFQTPSGVQSSVFVPKARYTPDNVRAAIAQAVATIEAVHASTSNAQG